MSCRHDLANGTCVDCYPATGKIEPEDMVAPGMMDGPGARGRAETWIARTATYSTRDKRLFQLYVDAALHISTRTMEAAAEAIGVPVSTLSRWRSGRQAPVLMADRSRALARLGDLLAPMAAREAENREKLSVHLVEMHAALTQVAPQPERVEKVVTAFEKLAVKLGLPTYDVEHVSRVALQRIEELEENDE